MKESNEKLFRRHWRWMAETGARFTHHWPEWKHNGGECHAENFCFCCRDCGIDCDDCPVDWGGEDCCDGRTLYMKWSEAKTPRTRKKYAALIAELPWRGK